MKYILILAALVLALVGVIHPAEAKDAKKEKAGAKAAKLKKVPNAVIDAGEWLGSSCAERGLAHMRNRKAASTVHEACVKLMKLDPTLETNEAVDLAVEAYCPPCVTSDDFFACERDSEQEKLMACETGQLDKCLSGSGSVKDKKTRATIMKYAACRKKAVVEAQKKRLHYNDVYDHIADRCQWPDAMEAEFGEADGDYESSSAAISGYHGLGCIDTGNGRGCGGRLPGMAEALAGSGKELVVGHGNGGCGWNVEECAANDAEVREMRRQLRVGAAKEKQKGKKAKPLKPAPVNPWMDWQ